MTADDALLPRCFRAASALLPRERVMTWQDERMTLAPRHRCHTKSPANLKHPFIADEEIEAPERPVVLLDSTTALKTPDVAAKTMALGVLPHSTTTMKTPDVVAEMTMLSVLDAALLRRRQFCERWGWGWGRNLPEPYCILGGISADRPTGLNHTGKAIVRSYNPVYFVHS